MLYKFVSLEQLIKQAAIPSQSLLMMLLLFKKKPIAGGDERLHVMKRRRKLHVPLSVLLLLTCCFSKRRNEGASFSYLELKGGRQCNIQLYRYAVVNKIQEVFLGRSSPSFNSKAQQLRSSDIRNTVPTTDRWHFNRSSDLKLLNTYSLLIKENADLNKYLNYIIIPQITIY